MTAWSRFWCRITFRHRGDVVSILPEPGGPFWMCRNCGAVIR